MGSRCPIDGRQRFPWGHVSQVRILPGPPTCSYLTHATFVAFLDDHDRRANERALRDGARPFNSYATRSPAGTAR